MPTATPNSTVLRHAKPSSHRNQPPWVAATHSPATCHSVSGIAAHPAFPNMLLLRSRNSQLCTSLYSQLFACLSPSCDFAKVMCTKHLQSPSTCAVCNVGSRLGNNIVCWCVSILNPVFYDGSSRVCCRLISGLPVQKDGNLGRLSSKIYSQLSSLCGQALKESNFQKILLLVCVYSLCQSCNADICLPARCRSLVLTIQSNPIAAQQLFHKRNRNIFISFCLLLTAGCICNY